MIYVVGCQGAITKTKLYPVVRISTDFVGLASENRTLIIPASRIDALVFENAEDDGGDADDER